ncbi:MAG: ABC transporter permease [Anaeroplasmataceae bacterium]
MINKLLEFNKDTCVMLGRSMKHIFRSFDTIITVCVTPIAIMLLMVYVFGGAMGGGMSTSEYVTYSLPGILLISISTSVAYTALRLYTDIKSGFFDRLKSMPISSSSALWAHVITSLVSNFISLSVILIVAIMMGFRSNASFLNWLCIIGILIVFILTLTWVAVIAGLKGKSPEGATVFSYPLIFLPFISSAFLSTDTMPKAVRIFAENQPITAIVNSLRSLMLNTPVGNDIWIALAWCTGIMAVAYIIAIRMYKKR